MAYLLSDEFQTHEAAAYAAKLARSYAPIDTGWMKRNTKKYGKRVYSYAEYASYVNYGTDRMPARPFFTRAMEEAQELDNSMIRAIAALARLALRF